MRIEEAFCVKNIKKLRDILNNVPDDTMLQNNLEFLALIDSIVPKQEIIERYLMSNELMLGKNHQFSQSINKIKNQMDLFLSQYNRIILYGNGTLTSFIKHVFGNKLVVIADQNKDEFVCSPKEISSYDFDCIIITVLGRESGIKAFLVHECGVDESKIKMFDL